MEDIDENIKNWMKADFEEVTLGDDFTPKLMDTIQNSPTYTFEPLISVKVWRRLLYAFICILLLLIGTSINFEHDADWTLNIPNLNLIILENWLPFSTLFLIAILIIGDEFWRRNSKKKASSV